MQIVYLNGKDFENIAQVHDYLAEKLNFPAYYGNNLSALYDVLTELCENTNIVANLEGVTDEAFFRQLERLTQVMKDAADANDYLEVSLEGSEEKNEEE